MELTKSRSGLAAQIPSFQHIILCLGGRVLRKKSTKETRVPTGPVSVCFKAGVHEILTKLIAVRKLQDSKAAVPSSVVGIVDAAVIEFADQLKAMKDPGFIPVPPNDCVRVSLRVSARSAKVAQAAATRHDVRLTDFYRTAVTRYIRRHEEEISSYRAKKQRASKP
jgi:hypothetical protein